MHIDSTVRISVYNIYIYNTTYNTTHIYIYNTIYIYVYIYITITYNIYIYIHITCAHICRLINNTAAWKRVELLFCLGSLRTASSSCAARSAPCPAPAVRCARRTRGRQQRRRRRRRCFGSPTAGRRIGAEKWLGRP